MNGMSEAGSPSSVLDDFLEFRNGKTSPRKVDTGAVVVFGSNGPIGRSDVSNIDGDVIVIGRVGSYCGSLHYSTGQCWVTDNAIACTAKHGEDARFWYYALQALGLNGRSSGSGQPLLNQKVLGQIRFSPPAPRERSAIAAVLGVLDDKIAANTKIAQTADDLAVASFHHAARGATYTGETFADVAKVSGGGTPSTKVPDYWGGDISWATPTDITALAGPYLESTSRTITEEGLVACSSELFAPGAILMTSRATIGAFAVAQVPTAVNQGFIVVEPKDETLRYWMLHDMRSRVDEFIAMANGATFLELSRGNFKKFQIHVAEAEVMHRFGERAAALHDSARQALRENQALAELRDSLLPELMSGRLRVKDAEAAAAEAGL